MNYILLHWAFGRQSMQMTVDSMEESCDLLLKSGDGWIGYVKERGEYIPVPSIRKIIDDPETNLINCGNHIFADDSLFRINKPSMINNASNKSVSRRMLRDAGIKVPITFFYGESVEFPCIARPSHHHGGNHFHIINNMSNLSALAERNDLHDWYFALIFVKTHEYRVHCAHGKVLIIQEKPLVDGEIRGNQAVNHESWRILKWSEFHPGICIESLRAVEALGLDYGAVDIMYNAENNTFAICEVNTSPSINTEYTSGKYGKYFDWLIRNDYPAHFNIDARSLVFTNKLLGS